MKLTLTAAMLCAGLASAAGAATISSGYATLDGRAPIVIGHRGAPAYLPENSIGGNELAAKMKSRFVETDVMLTADGVLVAMHDPDLARTTNVEDFYAPRNGAYRTADFTYEEISALTVEPTGRAGSTYPGFDPMAANPYRVPTFADMLDALTEYNAANGTSVGMLTEGKYADNVETSRMVIETLIEKGYATSEKSAVQSFGFGNVAEYARLLDAAGIEMGVAQLGFAELTDGEWIISRNKSLDALAAYTDTVALFAGSITEDLIAAAHIRGLSVFGWTFRPEDFDAALAQVSPFLDWGLDGFITDNPDLISDAIGSFRIAAVPLPAALPMLTLALGGLGGIAATRRRRAA